MDIQTFNARITKTMLGFEDHGILTIWLYLELDGSGQGFGGYALDDKPLDGDRSKTGYSRQPTKLCGRAITGILQALEVSSWEKLPGTYVRVHKADFFAPITRIGHVIKDRWFSFEDAARVEVTT